MYLNDLENLAEDVRLIFKNCNQYNLDDSPASKQAKRLETFFENELYFELRTKLRAEVVVPLAEHASSPLQVALNRMCEADKKTCNNLLRRFEKKDGASWFRHPV